MSCEEEYHNITYIYDDLYASISHFLSSLPRTTCAWYYKVSCDPSRMIILKNYLHFFDKTKKTLYFYYNEVSSKRTYFASFAPFGVWKLLMRRAVAVPLGYVSLYFKIIIYG